MQPPIRRTNTSAKKGWIKATILIVAWVLIFSLAKDFWRLKKGYGRIEEAKVRLAQEEVKNQMLKDKLAVVLTDEYKEKIIREQLNMQKLGEVVAVLPKKDTLTANEEKVEAKEMKNWEKWWALLK